MLKSCMFLKKSKKSEHLTLYSDNGSIISAKVKHSVNFHKYFTYHHQLISLILSAKRSAITN